MLRVHTLLLSNLRALAPKMEEIRKHDADLARQLRRAYTSSILNTAEGQSADGGNRRARFCSAVGSLDESIAALEIASTLGMTEVDDALRDAMQHSRAMLLKLARPRRIA